MRSRAPVNDNGAIVGTASLTTTAGTTTHGVMLCPIEFVYETQKGSGNYQVLEKLLGDPAAVQKLTIDKSPYPSQ